MKRNEALSLSPPTGLTIVSVSSTSIKVSWKPSKTTLAAVDYGVYANEELEGSTASTSFAIGRLSCGTSYDITVGAYALGRSARSSLIASTSPCADSRGIPGCLELQLANRRLDDDVREWRFRRRRRRIERRLGWDEWR